MSVDCFIDYQLFHRLSIDSSKLKCLLNCPSVSTGRIFGIKIDRQLYTILIIILYFMGLSRFN